MTGEELILYQEGELEEAAIDSELIVRTDESGQIRREFETSLAARAVNEIDDADIDSSRAIRGKHGGKE